MAPFSASGEREWNFESAGALCWFDIHVYCKDTSGIAPATTAHNHNYVKWLAKIPAPVEGKLELVIV